MFFGRETRSLCSLVRPHRMPGHLLTFELPNDGGELLIHADPAGVRYLASALTRLAQHAEAGRKEHIHLMTKDWSGHELSSVALDSERAYYIRSRFTDGPREG